jgi:hypothetical protein
VPGACSSPSALATTPGRREVARFTGAADRRKLKAGRYVAESAPARRWATSGPRS